MMNCWEAVKFIGFIYDLQNKMYFFPKESYSSSFKNITAKLKRVDISQQPRTWVKTPSRLSIINSIYIDEEIQAQTFATGS